MLGIIEVIKLAYSITLITLVALITCSISETSSSKKLSLLDSTTIIMGSMIGSGIFIVSTDIAKQVQTPGMLLLAWILTGVITVLGALSYGELAAMMPRAGDRKSVV